MGGLAVRLGTEFAQKCGPCMAWQQRGKSHFYYRSRREGTKTFRDYMGRGPEAELSANLDIQRREQRQAARAGWAEFVARVQEADAALDNLSRHCRLLAATVLLTHGFRCHNGEWRRYRVRRRKIYAG
jgi:hypothetical protein